MKLIALTLVIAACSLAALGTADVASAHIYRFHPSLAKRSLAERAAGQRLVIRHDRSILHSTAWLAGVDSKEPLSESSTRLLAIRNFHAAQLRWSRRELRETEATIRRNEARARSSAGRASRDWLAAVSYVQRGWPGSSGWLISCSSTEGGHGRWFPNTQGSGAGGWMQFMSGTFYGNVDGAFAYGRARGLFLPRSARSWYSPLGQAATGADMLRRGQSGQWTGAGC